MHKVPQTSQPAVCSMPSPNTPAQKNMVFIESEDDLEYLTDPESDPDEYYPIENQLGLPQYQNFFIESSPPPVNVDAKVNCDELNNKGEFFLKERFAKAKLSVTRRRGLQSSSQCR
jgi:hypothetical protein